MYFRVTPRGPDLISEVVGDVRFAAPYYPKELTPAHLKFPVGISRLYLLMTPRVAVDYEPSPLDDVPLMHCEAKRQWCHAHGIVYVPIFLREKLTKEQFEERLKIEREALDNARKTADIKEALVTDIEDEEFNRLVDEEALRRLAQIRRFRQAGGGLNTTPILRRIRKDVETEYLTKRRNGDLGHYLSYLKPALAAR